MKLRITISKYHLWYYLYKRKGGKMPPRDKLYEVDLTNQLPHVTKLWMTSLVVIVVFLVRSSTPNCSGWTQNLIRKHQGYYFTQDRDSSLFTQEYAKELIEAQGNIIYKDILRNRKATQDLICMASVLGKLKTSSCYLRDENHAMDTCAIQWRTAKC